MFKDYFHILHITHVYKQTSKQLNVTNFTRQSDVVKRKGKGNEDSTSRWFLRILRVENCENLKFC